MAQQAGTAYEAVGNVSHGRPPLAVLLVEEHALIRAGLGALIDATSGLSLVAEAQNVSQAIALARAHCPATILVGASTLAHADSCAIAELRAAHPRSCIFILGESDGNSGDKYAVDIVPAPDTTHSAVRRLRPDVSMQEFCADVSQIFGIPCEDCRLQTICPVARAVTALTRRERQVAVRVAAGLTTKQIASMLGLAIRTVNTYRESLSRKIGASSAAALTRYVIESGLRDITTT